MDRVTVQFGANPLDTDILNSNRYPMIGLGMALQALLGAGPNVDGLPCAPGTGLAVNIGQGSIYVSAPIDETDYGSLPADTTDMIVQQGITFGETSLSVPAPTTAGQSIAYLVEAQFQQVDSDPVQLLYYNSTPGQQLQPILGTATNTKRGGVCALQVKAGTPATTGTQVTPTVDAGWTALYVVTVAYGATSIVSGNIALAAGAPFVQAKLGNLIQVCSGNPNGVLAGSAGVVGLSAPSLAWDAAENTIWVCSTTGTASAAVWVRNSLMQVYAGNPNGNVAGSAGTPAGPSPAMVWDTAENALWICVTTGTASTAVWSRNSLLPVYAGNPNGHVAGTAGTAGGASPSMIWDTTEATLWICTASGTTTTAVWSRNSLMQVYAGNPNGVVAGLAGVAGGASPSMIWDTSESVLWICTTAGTATTAVWSRSSLMQVYGGNPNGAVAGNAGAIGGASPSVIWDETDTALWVCTTTGTATTAVWTKITGPLSGLGIGLGLYDNAGNLAVLIADSSIRATTAGLQTSGPVVALSGTVAVAAANNAQKFVGIGTLMLPAAASLWNGFRISAAALGGGITLTPNGTDKISGGTPGAAYPLANGVSAEFVCDGVSNWNVLFLTPVGGGSSIQYINAATVLTKGDYLVDTSASRFTCLLPASPTQGTILTFADANASWGRNPWVLGNNGATIMGQNNSLTVNVADQNFTIWFNGATWRLD
ncbi:hypothetical protein P3T40_003380 [Paraburkholderia sp. EB58]|uniref:hypothetical protein n=1 Tax=Paraburkholderia sp. EB58 TaxID=3035125 RepID=UPI003D1C73A0